VFANPDPLVQVTPKFDEYAEFADPVLIATNFPLPYVILFHVPILGKYEVFQVTKLLFEYRTLEPGIALPPVEIITQ
jgi:hypothetical protein